MAALEQYRRRRRLGWGGFNTWAGGGRCSLATRVATGRRKIECEREGTDGTTKGCVINGKCE